MKNAIFLFGFLLLMLSISGQTNNWNIVFEDDFSGDLSNWVDMYPNDPNGNWYINSNGQLYGNYNVSCGSVTCPQADLLLKDSLQIADHYRASVEFHKVTLYPGYDHAGALFSSWLDTDNKFVIGIGLGGSTPLSSVQDSIKVGVQIRQTTWQLGTSWNFYFPWNLDSTNVATLEKHGNIYSIFVNDIFLMDYVDTFLNGNGKLGFHTYGAISLDNFKLDSCSAISPLPQEGNFLATGLVGNNQIRNIIESNGDTIVEATLSDINAVSLAGKETLALFTGGQTWNGVQLFDSSQAADIVSFVNNGGRLYIQSRAGFDNLLSQFGVIATGNDGGSSGFNWPLIELSATSFATHPYTVGLTSIVGDVGASFTVDGNWTVLGEDTAGTDLLAVRNYGQGEVILWYGQRSFRDPGPTGNVYETDITEGSNTQFYTNLFNPTPIPLQANLTVSYTSIVQGDSLQFTDLSTGNPTTWEWIFEGGTPTASTDQNPMVAYYTTGDFDVTLIVGDGLTFDTLMINNYIHVSNPTNPIPPNWNYTNTGNNHTILIPQSADVTIDGIPVVSGDYIGVFYDSAGTMACAGYIVYNTSGNLALTAWGDDSQTTVKEGFNTNEAFTWKVWNSQNGETVGNVNVTYNNTFPNLGLFSTNGMSGIMSIEAITQQTQNITLVSGWSIWSTYIDAFEPSLDSIFVDIISEVSIVKDGGGMVFWPQWNINDIGNLTIGEGYQIKMLSQQTLEVTGLAVIPENTSIQIPLGWSIIGYLLQASSSTTFALTNIDTTTISIMKDGGGNVYWPQWGIDNIITMYPGEGYQIKMNSSQILVFPPNTPASAKSSIQIKLPTYFKNTTNTGSNMTLGIPVSSWETLPAYGNEIGVYSQSGLLVGSGVFIGDNMAITLWGNDEYSVETDGLNANENFMLRIWNEENQLESEVIVEHWLEGDGTFGTNKIAIAGSLSNFQLQISNFKLYQNFPNPFTGQTKISYYLPDKCEVAFDIFNLLGEKVEPIHEFSLQPAGKHSLTFDSGSLPAGSYYYRLQTPDFSETRKMTILK